MDRSKANKRNWILVWEDGFCNFSACAGPSCDSRAGSSSFLSVRQSPSNDGNSEAMNPELFFKMSHEVYNYGEGLMGKVAVENSHKWVHREPLENEMSFLSPWQTSLDPHPRTWEAHFKSGIQTIAVVSVQEGVLQLGSTIKIVEDLNFVLYMQRKFNFLYSISGGLVPTSVVSGGSRPSNGLPLEGGHSYGQLSRRSIDQFLQPWVRPHDLWRPTTNSTFAGMKRPSEYVEPLSVTEYSYLDGSGFEQCRPECPSSPKALNAGHTSPLLSPSSSMPAVVPSMSSLHALLSKLPSVKTLDAENETSRLLTSCALPSNRLEGNFTCNLPPMPQPVSKIHSERAQAKEAISAGKRVVIIGELMASGIEMSPPNSGSDLTHSTVGEDMEEQQNQSTMARENYLYANSTFLETFDKLNGYETPESLDNGDSSYSSFLNEICS